MSFHDSPTHVDRLFTQALEQRVEDRAEFLRSACGDNAELLREVQSLLDAAGAAGESFLETPALVLEDEGDEAHELDDGAKVGVYRVVREIGGGGMGKVYLAVRDDDVYQQRVAVKVLKRGLDTDEIVRRFERERRLLARLDHPHIVRILDGGTTDDGLPYFVMEYVEGQTLDRYCTSHELSLRVRLELFREICAAVGFAHQNLVVHRDLKPQNILVDHRGAPKLLDFGIAKLLDPGDAPNTGAGTLLMTPDYASPEQLAKGPITTASDVYSLGRLLYELLTGEVPSRIRAPRNPLHREPMRHPEPVPPSRRPGCRHLAGDIDSIVLQALEHDPQSRYASVEQLSEDIGRHLQGLPVHARPATAAYHLGKFVRRHRWQVLIAVLIFSGTLGFGVSMKLLRDEADRERQAAEHARQVAERERERATEAITLLKQAFRSSDPAVSRTPDLTLREFLDEQSEAIDAESVADPAVRADLLNVMGGSYLGLGLYDKALPLLAASVDLRRETPGVRPDTLAASLTDLAEGLMRCDQVDSAERLLFEALEILRRESDGDRFLAKALNNNALLFKNAGRFAMAEDLYRESLAMKIRLVGEDHGDVARSRHNLAALLREMGQLVEAEPLYRQSLETRVELYGEDSPEAAVARTGLALLLADRGELETAESMLRDVVEIRRASRGDGHRAVGYSLVNLGFVLQLRGDHEEAEVCFDEAMRIFTARFGEEHSRVAIVLRHQASLRLAEGRADDAERLARRAVVMLRQVSPSDVSRIAEAESVLGACLHALGRTDEAEPLLRSSYEALRSKKGTNARQTREALARLEGLGQAPRAGEAP